MKYRIGEVVDVIAWWRNNLTTRCKVRRYDEARYATNKQGEQRTLSGEAYVVEPLEGTYKGRRVIDPGSIVEITP